MNTRLIITDYHYGKIPTVMKKKAEVLQYRSSAVIYYSVTRFLLSIVLPQEICGRTAPGMAETVDDQSAVG